MKKRKIDKWVSNAMKVLAIFCFFYGVVLLVLPGTLNKSLYISGILFSLSIFAYVTVCEKLKHEEDNRKEIENEKNCK